MIGSARAGRPLPLRVDEVPSTQDLAFEMAAAGAPDGASVVAGRQTAGRGRLGRGWDSPRGAGLWLSRVVRPPLPAPAPPVLVAATALAVADAVERVSGLRAALRWPNDLVLGDRKVAGLLLETRDFRPDAPVLVLGVGINVAQREADFPPEIRAAATSLHLAGAGSVDLDALLGAVLDALDHGLSVAAAPGGAERVDALYADRAAFRNERVRLLDGDRPREGILLAASPLAGVVLRSPEGAAIRVRAEHARDLRRVPSGGC